MRGYVHTTTDWPMMLAQYFKFSNLYNSFVVVVVVYRANEHHINHQRYGTCTQTYRREREILSYKNMHLGLGYVRTIVP